MIPNYCTQAGGNCPRCSLSNYGRDCTNVPLRGRFFSIGDLAHQLSTHPRQAAKIVNDSLPGGAERYDELMGNPAESVTRAALIDLVAARGGDYIGCKLAALLVD